MFLQLCADEITVRRYIAETAKAKGETFKAQAENSVLQARVDQLEKEKAEGWQIIEITDNKQQNATEPANYFKKF